MANKKHIPKKIELSATDPFLKYLAHMYNSGINYMTQSEDILKNMQDYKRKLNEFMENNKLKDLIGDTKKEEKTERL